MSHDELIHPAFDERITTAERYVAVDDALRAIGDLLIERAKGAFPGNDAGQKCDAMNYLLPFIRCIPNKTERDRFAVKVAYEIDLTADVLREELRRAATRVRS